MEQQRIQNYKIIKDIGKGANGFIYLAIKDEDNKEYALKMQNQDISDYEAEIINELKNYKLQNVVRSYEYFVFKSNFMEYNCIAMDYCNFGDLFEFLQKYRRNTQLSEKKEMIFQIAFGIWELHQFKIIHRDIKPKNILLHITDQTLYIKLCDLGLSKIEKQNDQHTVNIGTPLYMAPELIAQNNKQNYDSSVDIWALGLIIYDFFSEQQLFLGEIKTLAGIFQNIEHLNVANQLNIIEEPDLRFICQQCLNRDPSKRPTIEQVLNKLNPQKFEGLKTILQNDQPRIYQSQLRINQTFKNYQKENQIFEKQNPNNMHPQEQPNNINNKQSESLIQKLTEDQIRLRVSVLSKIKDQKYATKLVFMHSNQSKEDEIFNELKAKGDSLIQKSFEQK